LFTLLLPGLGHLYSGRPRRALLFFFLDALWAVLMVQVLIRVPTQGPNLYVPATLYWAFRLLAAADAVRIARAVAGTYTRRRFNRWYLYLTCLVLLGWAHLWTVLHAGVEMFYLQTRSMMRTLLPGESFLVDRLAYGLPWHVTGGEILRYAEPQHGHIVVYRSSFDGVPQNYVFRVLGVPGDVLQIRAGQLLVNGIPLDEPYLNLEGSPQRDYGPVTVPTGSFFMLGDSRNRSRDSRFADERFIKRQQILGRARVILSSGDPVTGFPRWDRFGTVIR
jgi:signal peptidase I